MSADEEQAAAGVAVGFPPDQQLRALLLHRLPQDEAVVLEQRLVVEDGVAERMRQLEYDLLDAYAGGRLGTQERRDVERWLLRTAQDRRRLGIARALAAMPRPASGGWLRRIRVHLGGGGPLLWGGALAGVAAAIVAGVLLQPLGEAPRGLQPAAAVLNGSSASVYTISLLTAVSRGGQARPLTLPAGTAQVRVQAEVESPDDDAVYELQVLDREGTPVQSAYKLRLLHAGQHAYIEALIPAASLPGLRRIAVRTAAGASVADWTVEITAGG
ncbi:MAG: hypothetical protein JWR07_5542 [Nevskia sp.]|nr:hypothetical protein [Nevskia sp.]